MKPEEIKKLAEFMGWKIYKESEHYIIFTGNPNKKYTLVSIHEFAKDLCQWHPYKNIFDAWMLVEKATEIMLGGDLQVRPKIYYNGVGKEWYCMFDGTVISEHHKSAPMAICKAVLKLEESNG